MADGRRATRLGPIPACRRLAAALAALLLTAALAVAQPFDMKQMSGIPRPVDDLPNGSVSVRLIRGDATRNITNHPVEMQSGGRVQTVNTDGEGRAQFDNLAPGTPVRFVATVDGERLESQEFQIQPRGGVRLLLVATDPEEAKRAATPAMSGQVVLGSDTNIIIEPGDESVLVYYVLSIMNEGAAPVNPPTPFAFSLQASALRPTVIQGSSPLAKNDGPDVTVSGPFPPGVTAVQVAAEYPIVNGRVEIAQTFPAAMKDVVVIAKKVGRMSLASPQFTRVQESVSEGTPVVFGVGGALDAGKPLTLTIEGLPYHSGMPRTIALVLAAGIVAIGAWAAMRPAGDPDDKAGERKRLVARREKLFQDLVRLEHDHRRGRIDAGRYRSRREDLLQSLEQVYGALDDDETGPEPASRSGVAA